jgi:adenylate cyclase
MQPKDSVPVLDEGLHEKVIVLMADFCSFSKFVQASGQDPDLVVSMMGRFYRQAREIIQDNGGILDKFMGDGILAFWLRNKSETKSLVGEQFDYCLYQLVGMAAKIAKEWQQQIDIAISPVGLRCGAALGSMLLISETSGANTYIHAIGDAINIAARLQSAARPNCVLISNKLRTDHFAESTVLAEHEDVEAKNIGKVKVWMKDLISTRVLDVKAANE